jgi:hypothetical protein
LYLLTICSWVFGIFEEKVFFMHSQKLGSTFEVLTENFFIYLFELVGFQVNNNWIQKSGTQNGFDVGFQIAVNNDIFFKRDIYIECKNYNKSKLDKVHLHTKLIELSQSSYNLKNAIYFFVSPRVDLNLLSQDSNPKFLEDYFNESFGFKTIILTPNNRIKEILSLNENIFRAVYLDEEFYELDILTKESIITFFKKLFLSKGEIPNFNELSVKREYLNEASIGSNDIYITRKLNNSSFEEFTLLEIIKNDDFILVLGDPGSGKSTELKNVVKYFEANILDHEITPVFINLANSNKVDEISDLFPDGWELNKKVILIIDSFDEYTNKDRLIKKLFEITNNSKINLKIIISCRTYAYNEEFASLNPSKYYMNNFSNNEVKSFLEKKYKIEKDEIENIIKLLDDKMTKDLYFIDLLGTYYEKNKVQFTKSNIHKFIFFNNLTSENISNYSILGFVFELSNINTINELQLKKMFGLKYASLLKDKLFDKAYDNLNYKFKHKNCQEFFAANFISEFEYEKIKQIILIPETNKIHPSLYNTVTFLINVLEGEKQLELIEWFVINQPELLFKADKNRIDSYRIKVFQDFFNHHCIEKSYWITTNNQLTVKEIAEFGDCLGNYDYLINLIDSDKHFRVTISAIEILNFFQPIIYDRSEKLKEYLLNKIKCSELNKEIKSHLINCIYVHKFHHSGDYLRLIFENFTNESHKELNNSLLRLINDCDNVDEYFWFIKKEFEFENDIEPRVEVDNVIRGNRWLLDDIIIKINSSDYFLKIAYYIFSEEFNFYIDTTFENEFLEKCIEFSNNEDNFLEKLLDSIKNKMHFFSFEKKINRIFNSISQAKQNKVYEYLITNFKFSEVEYFLATITNNQNVSIIIDFFIKNNKQHSPDFFRNFMFSSGKNELALEFEKVLINKGVNFSILISIEGIVARKKLISDKPQINFDLLFNKKELLSEIKSIFTKYNVLSFDNQIIYEIESEWYEVNGHDNVIDISYSLLSKIFINKKNVTIVDVEEYINNEINILEEIKNLIIRNKSFTHKFLIKTKQSKFIENLCQEISKKIDFSQIIISKTLSTFSLGSNHDIWKLILFFDNELNLKLSTDFYLNSLEFFDYSLSNFENDLFEKLVYKIDDKSTVDSKVVSNINYKVLFSFGLKKHIKYVIENELNEAYEKIKEIIYLNDDSLINKYIESIYLKSDDVNFLLKCSVDIETDKCWTSIKLLSKMDSFKVYCESKSKEYIDTIEKRDSNYYLFNAISCLFEVNSINAINYYIKLIQLKKYDYLHSFGKLNYSIIEDFGLINELFDLAYSYESRNNYTNDVGSFLNNLIHNLSSKNTVYNQKVNEKLEEIKNGLSDSDINYDSKLFYINLLIDKNADCLLNLLSKPLDFKEALKKVEKILN